LQARQKDTAINTRRQGAFPEAASQNRSILYVPRFLPSGLFHLPLILTAVVITLVVVNHAGLLHMPGRFASILPRIARFTALLPLFGCANRKRAQQNKDE
jgi:hypothetical protein